MDPRDMEYMALALEEARQADREDEVPVGAVIVRNGAVLARAHNRMEATGDPTAHAELLAIQAAVKKGPLDGAALYVTLEPCAMCAMAAIHARIGRIVFGAFDEAAGCCGSVMDMTDHWFDHSIETIGGLCEVECGALISDFFRRIRR